MQIYLNCSPEKNVLYCGTVVQQKTNIFNSWSSPSCYKKCCKAKIKFPRTDIQNYFSKALTWSKKSGKIAEKDLHLWTENTTLPANLGFFKDLFLYLSNYCILNYIGEVLSHFSLLTLITKILRNRSRREITQWWRIVCLQWVSLPFVLFQSASVLLRNDSVWLWNGCGFLWLTWFRFVSHYFVCFVLLFFV